MMHTIAKDYGHITRRTEMMQIVQQLWDEYLNDKWNKLIESMMI